MAVRRYVRQRGLLPETHGQKHRRYDDAAHVHKKANGVNFTRASPWSADEVRREDYRNQQTDGRDPQQEPAEPSGD